MSSEENTFFSFKQKDYCYNLLQSHNYNEVFNDF